MDKATRTKVDEVAKKFQAALNGLFQSLYLDHNNDAALMAAHRLNWLVLRMGFCVEYLAYKSGPNKGKVYRIQVFYDPTKRAKTIGKSPFAEFEAEDAEILNKRREAAVPPAVVAQQNEMADAFEHMSPADKAAAWEAKKAQERQERMDSM